MAHPVDQHVGKRIRHRRWLVGMTQQQLADQVGIKFQQIQKYETGANRVSASRLWDISKSLQVDISFFFEGIEGDEAQVEPGGHHPMSYLIKRPWNFCGLIMRSLKTNAAACLIWPAF